MSAFNTLFGWAGKGKIHRKVERKERDSPDAEGLSLGPSYFVLWTTKILTSLSRNLFKGLTAY